MLLASNIWGRPDKKRVFEEIRTEVAAATLFVFSPSNISQEM
jgi:hypothetical protein